MSKKLPASPQRRKLVNQQIGPLDKRSRRGGGLTKRVRIAIDAIMFDRCYGFTPGQTAGLVIQIVQTSPDPVKVAPVIEHEPTDDD
jgi:hypothetical protein